jgi:hypothetical protein
MIEPASRYSGGVGSNADYPVLYWCFAWLHEPAVANALFPIIFATTHRTSSGMYRKDVFQALTDGKWLELLVELLTDQGNTFDPEIQSSSDIFENGRGT